MIEKRQPLNARPNPHTDVNQCLREWILRTNDMIPKKIIIDNIVDGSICRW